MRYRELIPGKLRVSELSLGTWQNIQALGASDLFSFAADHGVNLFDTADSYDAGIHEEFLGKWLNSRSNREIIVATKTFSPVDSSDSGGLSPIRLRRALESSLRRLQLETIDLYQLHRYDPAIPLEEIINAISQFMSEGKIRFWGVCRWPIAPLKQLEQLSDAAHIPRPCAHQYHYNLFSPTLDEPGLVHTDSNLKAVVYSPLAQGVLTGKYSGGIVPDGSRAIGLEAGASMWDLKPEKLAQVDIWSARCREMGFTVSQFALAWCLRKSNVGTVLTGAKNRIQFLENLGYSRVPLDLALIERILA